jgi:pilus assembly protein TadC
MFTNGNIRVQALEININSKGSRALSKAVNYFLRAMYQFLEIGMSAAHRVRIRVFRN